MGRILENWRVPAAGLFAVVLIIGAYIFARGIGSPPAAEASAETALLKAIAAKDSDNDGLPDWEEVLYGTDPHNPDSNHLGMTDGDAVAKGLIVPKAIANMPTATSTLAADSSTRTEAFAKDFFTLYLAAKQSNGGVDLSTDQTNALADQAINQLLLTSTQASSAKSMSDLKVSGTGPDALRAFAIVAEAVFKKNMDTTITNEMQALQDAVQNNDTDALSQLTSAAQIYRNYAAGLAALTVPQELAADNLMLINAMLLRSEVDDNFASVNTDPLAAMLAIQQFGQTESDFWNAFSNIGATYASAGVTLPTGTPGASFVNVIANARQVTP
ncbi:MAG: thrombospondin type 3 repeat-containing protein [Candidatus Paceibacterota bacterium]